MNSFRRVVVAAAVLLLGTLPAAFAFAGTRDIWTKVPDNANSGQILTGLICYSPTNCVATSGVKDDVYLSNDGGRTWSVSHSLENLANQHGLTCIANGTCFQLAYLEDTATTPIKYIGVAITKSTDGGSHWSEVYSSRVSPETGIAPSYVLSSVSCPSNSECVVVGHNGNASFRLSTSNGGHSWTKSKIFGAPFVAIACPTTIVCYGVKGQRDVPVYKSTDSGLTWTTMPAPINYFFNKNDGPVLGFALGSIACYSDTWCAVGGYQNTHYGNSYGFSPVIWGMANGSTWLYGGSVNISAFSPTKSIVGGGISCPSFGHCVAETTYGTIVDVTYLKRSLKVSRDIDSPATNSVSYLFSCRTHSWCVSVAVNEKNITEFRLMQIGL